MSENIIISCPEKLEKSKKAITEGGAEKLHILADFDRTLTKTFVDGKSTPSLISILRDGNYLTPDYSQKAQGLYAKYHPIEIDPKIPLEEKKKAMEEWWMSHFELLIKSGLNKKVLERIVGTGKVKFREGFSEIADFLKKYNIPLVIMSSSGLGEESILLYLEKAGKLYDNIHIISNTFEWDENGRVIRVKQPIIHVLNKDETVVKDFPVFEVIKNKTNVLLLGDNLEDVGMIKGFDYDNLIKIGFLNEKVEENLEYYKNKFDVVILNDGSLEYINKLLRDIIK